MPDPTDYNRLNSGFILVISNSNQDIFDYILVPTGSIWFHPSSIWFHSGFILVISNSNQLISGYILVPYGAILISYWLNRIPIRLNLVTSWFQLVPFWFNPGSIWFYYRYFWFYLVPSDSNRVTSGYMQVPFGSIWFLSRSI